MRDYAELIHDLRCCSDVGTCNSCSREKDSNTERCDSIEREAADAIEELLDELTTIRKQFPRWISVEERLPDRLPAKFANWSKEVFVAVKRGREYRAYVDRYSHIYKTWGAFGGEVTHWMPLPSTEGLK